MNLLVARHVINISLPANNPYVQRTNVSLSVKLRGTARRSRPTVPEETAGREARPHRRRKETTQEHTNGLCCAPEEPNKPESNNQTNQEERPNFPSLPLQNRFSALKDTTPDPQPEPRHRSGSLPDYTTKRTAPPPPPPKPKTPSYIRALLSQKPPAYSGEPPHKQPRQSR
ncbi:hypothetical protein HPB50_019716 [Hyalomma asiaticum]|uniref:Uncharacterized protein n=1 Tax=Hyalomma asiaticum TaxID=266040 RepID=A0ACB7SN10_HYAAI|nr:hypothetical protein HPB50_019716 [Hyalomma asiaticum]